MGHMHSETFLRITKIIDQIKMSRKFFLNHSIVVTEKIILDIFKINTRVNVHLKCRGTVKMYPLVPMLNGYLTYNKNISVS